MLGEIAVLLIYANFPLLVNCGNIAFKVGSELEMFMVFSLFSLPAKPPRIQMAYTYKDTHALIPCSLGKLCMRFRNVLVWDRKQWMVVKVEYTKSWVCEFLVLVWCPSTMIALIWIIVVPANNGENSRNLFSMENSFVILWGKCTMGRTMIFRVMSATIA